MSFNRVLTATHLLLLLLISFLPLSNLSILTMLMKWSTWLPLRRSFSLWILTTSNLLLSWSLPIKDVRPFKCEFCDYQSRTNSQLKVHMMRHAGEWLVNNAKFSSVATAHEPLIRKTCESENERKWNKKRVDNRESKQLDERWNVRRGYFFILPSQNTSHPASTRQCLYILVCTLSLLIRHKRFCLHKK